MADDTSEIPHNQYLTWVDTMKAQFHPMVDRNHSTGEVVYPRREYLTTVAAYRKEQADAQAAKTAKPEEGEEPQ